MRTKWRRGPHDRITFPDGEFDEIVISNPGCVHFERLSNGQIWFGISLADGKRVAGCIYSRGRVDCNVTENELFKELPGEMFTERKRRGR